MTKLIVINSYGRITREYIAKDSDHAERIKVRIKSQLAPGHSYTFEKHTI